jgi:hypothetical protein
MGLVTTPTCLADHIDEEDEVCPANTAKADDILANAIDGA